MAGVAALIGILLLSAPALPAGASSSARPRLHVYDLSPVSVAGTRFAAGERLRVVVTTKRTFERRIVTNGNGAFRLVLRRVRVGPCVQVAVRAYHGRKLRAAAKTPLPSCGANIGPT